MMIKKWSTTWLALITLSTVLGWVVLFSGGKTAAQTGVLISAVRITNLRDQAFTVSWVTDQAVTGTVHYGTDPANLNQIAFDERGAAVSDHIHYVTLPLLTPDTLYYFDLMAGGATEDNGGAHYTVTTAPTLGLPNSEAIYGQIFLVDGVTPAENVVVYVMLFDDDGVGTPGQAAEMSSLTDQNGFWYVNLGNARTAGLEDYFSYAAEGDGLDLAVEGTSAGHGSQTVSPIGENPIDPIVLTEPSLVPPTLVMISGPPVGSPKTNHSFTASVSPANSTQPLSYTWQATHQSLITHTSGLSDSVAFRWDITGPQVITVTASNEGGMVTNTHVITIEKTTAVTLVSFTATASGNEVRLTWETATELDNAGFNLWRSTAVDGEYTKLNETLIPAQGSIDSGASYEYVDTRFTKAGLYYYKLEDIDVHGISTFHGPESVLMIPAIYMPIIRK